MAHTRIDLSSPSQGWAFAVILGLCVSLPLYLYGVPYGVDLPHHYRIASGFQESILGGDFYPSWLPSTNDGYGDPSVRFYPPALYLLLSASRMVAGDWYFASLATFSLLTVAGALGMYWWARTLGAGRWAVAAALLYLLSPFHANDLYQAGLYGQYAAGNVLPFVFAFAERVINGGGRRSVAGLGISYGLLILFHVPLAVLGSAAVALYALVRLIKSFGLLSVSRLTAGALLGVAVSCCYWLPMLRELKWKHPGGAGQGEWFDYQNNFLFYPSPNPMSNFLLPMLAFATLAMAAPAAVLLFKRNVKAAAPAIVAALTLLMATPLSKPVWDGLPILQETQFPWRWLTPASACLSALVAISLPELTLMWNSRRRPLSLALIGSVVIALSFTLMQLIRGATFQDRATFNQTVDSLRGSATNKDFLPTWAREARPMESAIDAGDRAPKIIEWSAERKVFSIDPGAATEVRLRTYYYPHWIATADARRLSTKPAQDGALLIDAPSEGATINVRFIEPVGTRVAGAVSVCGLLVILWLLAIRVKQGEIPARE